MTTNYAGDFHAWAIENARLLREGRFQQLDAEQSAEELEGMGASEKRSSRTVTVGSGTDLALATLAPTSANWFNTR